MNANIIIFLSFVMAMLHFALACINANDPLILGSQLLAVVFWIFHAKFSNIERI